MAASWPLSENGKRQQRCNDYKAVDSLSVVGFLTPLPAPDDGFKVNNNNNFNKKNIIPLVGSGKTARFYYESIHVRVFIFSRYAYKEASSTLSTVIYVYPLELCVSFHCCGWISQILCLYTFFYLITLWKWKCTRNCGCCCLLLLTFCVSYLHLMTIRHKWLMKQHAEVVVRSLLFLILVNC